MIAIPFAMPSNFQFANFHLLLKFGMDPRELTPARTRMYATPNCMFLLDDSSSITQRLQYCEWVIMRRVSLNSRARTFSSIALLSSNIFECVCVIRGPRQWDCARIRFDNVSVGIMRNHSVPEFLERYIAPLVKWPEAVSGFLRTQCFLAAPNSLPLLPRRNRYILQSVITICSSECCHWVATTLLGHAGSLDWT